MPSRRVQPVLWPTPPAWTQPVTKDQSQPKTNISPQSSMCTRWLSCANQTTTCCHLLCYASATCRVRDNPDPVEFPISVVGAKPLAAVRLDDGTSPDAAVPPPLLVAPATGKGKAAHGDVLQNPILTEASAGPSGVPPTLLLCGSDMSCSSSHVLPGTGHGST